MFSQKAEVTQAFLFPKLAILAIIWAKASTQLNEKNNRVRLISV
jgi:hypothetical protein